jgi:hypothetical protein
MYTTRIAWESLRTLNTATDVPFRTTFSPLGGPLLFPSYILKLVNNSNILITVSVDGTNATDVAPANSFWLYDEAKYSAPSLQFLPAGTQISVQSGTGAAGVGNVYLVTQYIVQN